VFWGEQRDTSYHAHESEPIMTWPLVILAAGAFIAGIMNLPSPILGIEIPGSHALEHFLEPVFEATGTPIEAPAFSVPLAVGTVLASLAALFVAYQVYAKRTWKKRFEDPLYRYLGFLWEGFENRWYADDVYNSVIINPFKRIGAFLSRVFDPRAIDGVVNGTARFVGLSGQSLRRAETGYIRSYALVFLVGVVAVLGYFGYLAVR
jgi:NADH-quinone oxidoreductase subunit L